MRGKRASLLLVPAVVASLAGIQGWHALAHSGYGDLAPVCRAFVSSRTVALSFDDGPSPRFTPEALRLLARYGDRATFFVIGSQAAVHPDLVRKELEAGMEVGNHTWSHGRLLRMNQTDRRSELQRAQGELAALGVPSSQARVFRPPYGDLDPALLRLARTEGLVPILWSLAVEHYTGGLGLNPGDAAARILLDVRRGDIILAHDGGGDRTDTIATLELLLPKLKERGFSVVTVGSFLNGLPLGRAVPRPLFWERGLRCVQGRPASPSAP